MTRDAMAVERQSSRTFEGTRPRDRLAARFLLVLLSSCVFLNSWITAQEQHDSAVVEESVSQDSSFGSAPKSGNAETKIQSGQKEQSPRRGSLIIAQLPNFQSRLRNWSGTGTRVHIPVSKK